ncbi:exocyst complex component 7-like [Dorcoceras hygrometricum]|uniref:Exocyst subunit Exo70 family protein n=1 Tax=Dorcoceras hygrometricum TaxID=472368 RepID=A0A2Z7AWQ3_9LAMI|nr:exocyst complex component 7-like [Dorcoceras hygrometricum]
MADNGEEKLIAIARQIAKSLGRTETMTDDIIKIFSNFDGRLREKLTERLSDDDVERILNSLDRQISGYISSERPIWASSADSSAFLDSVDKLITSIRDWTPLADDKNISSYLDRAEDLLQQSMFRLEDEFRTLAERGADSFDLTRGESAHQRDYSDEDDDVSVEDDDFFIPVAQPVKDYDIIIDALPAGTIGDLHEIAKRMVVAGYVKECSHVYSTYRREFLEESFSRLGLQKLSIDEVQKMQWAQLEDEIEKWVKAMNVTLRILFPSERRLCDRIFLGFSSAADLAFMEVCRGSTIQLLNFADAVAIGSRAPERLFKVLDVYEAVRDLMPEFELIFSDQYGITLRNEAITIWKRLGEAIRGVFMELENLIRRDPAKAAVPGGGVHPMTRYVMNYLRAACRSRRTLEQIFEESLGPHSGNFDYRKGDNRALSSSSSLAVRMEWIMEFLESNLEAKSKIYRDNTLSSVFMMNNGRYIVQKVKDNDLGTLLGDDWIRKHESKVKQYHVNYQRGTWSKVLAVLKIDSNSLSPIAPKSLRDKLKIFNTYFEEICTAQSAWVIVDEYLGEELRASIRGSLIPAYRNFIGRLQAVVDFGKNGDRHIRYSVEDIEAHIGQLFLGSGGGRR